MQCMQMHAYDPVAYKAYMERLADCFISYYTAKDCPFQPLSERMSLTNTVVLILYIFLTDYAVILGSERMQHLLLHDYAS